jgi:hypothetical protein
MSMPTHSLCTPGDEALSTPYGWSSSGEQRHSAVRHRLVVVPHAGEVLLKGPAVFDRDLPESTKLTNEAKAVTTVTSTQSVQDAVTTTVSAKLAAELSWGLGLGAKQGTSGVSQSLAAQLGGKLGAELIETLQQQLATTVTHSVTLSSETRDATDVTVPAGRQPVATRRVFGYLKYRKHWWDVYLHSSDVHAFEYKRPLLGAESRKTLENRNLMVRTPLGRISFYLPEPGLSIVFDRHASEVADTKAIRVEAFVGVCPRWVFAEPTALEVLAARAFPTPREQRDARTASGKSVKTAPASKPVKAPAKKAAKKTAKRAAAKKTARKPAARRARL